MIVGVLLAAGQSQRMGQPKLLLPWRGMPLVRHVAQTALQSRLDRVLVVVGSSAEHTTAAIADLPLTIVQNEAFLQGQSTSLRAGIAALEPAVEAALVLLADQPLLQARTIDMLLDAYRAQPAPAVVPRYRGQRGNPVLWDRELFGALKAIKGDQGARQVIAAHSDQIKWVDVDDRGVVLDLDTPDTYEQLQAIDRAL